MHRDKAVKVLLVEDDHGDAGLVKGMLSEAGGDKFDVTHVENLSDALKIIDHRLFDVGLIDTSLPEANGLDVIYEIQSVAPRLPLVALGGPDDETVALSAVECGVQDYLVKGNGDSRFLCRSLRHAVQRQRSHERLAYLAQHDELTGLPNRILFRDRLERALARADRNEWSVALLFLDLDGFKAINDTWGHQVGDLFLKSVADRLRDVIRMEDAVSRIGGDEFTVILERISHLEDAAMVAQKVIDALKPEFFIGNTTVNITTSIGIAVYPLNCDDIDALIRDADIAMYRAKQLHKNNYQFFTREINEIVAERQHFQESMRRALDQSEYVIHYLPQVDLATGRIVSLEALLRWQHPEQGLLMPDQFLPVQEESGVIIPVGRWVLREACIRHRAWQLNGAPRMRLTVNISCRQFHDKDIVESVADALEESGLDSECLQLDVTEESLMTNPNYAQMTINDLNNMGVKVCLDDFGTGYVSLGQLQHLPVCGVKIDRSFIRGMAKDTDNAAITNAIISLAQHLDLEVSAEGVETVQQLAYLHARGCDAAQGHFFDHPLQCMEVTSRLHERHAGWHYENQIRAALGRPV